MGKCRVATGERCPANVQEQVARCEEPVAAKWAVASGTRRALRDPLSFQAGAKVCRAGG